MRYGDALDASVRDCLARYGEHDCGADCPGVGTLYVPMLCGAAPKRAAPSRAARDRTPVRRAKPTRRRVIDTVTLHGSAAEARRVAYHEAGHAVAAYHVDFPLIAVSVLPSDSTAGRCQFEARGTEDQHLLVAVAGAVAESISSGRIVDVRGGDAAAAWRHARTSSRMRAGRRWAERVLRSRWASVRRVTNELVLYGSARGRRAFALIREGEGALR